MSTYTDALLAYHRAADDFLTEEWEAAATGRMPLEEAAQALAQAGDVLEREMEAMMRKIAVRER